MISKIQIKHYSTFITVGVINTAVDFGVYWILTRMAGIYFVLANVIAIIVATSAGFFLHKHLTFHNSDRKYFSQYVKFWGVSVGTLVLNSSIVYLLVRFISFHDIFAKVIATAVTMVWSYVMQRLWVFKKKESVIVV